MQHSSGDEHDSMMSAESRATPVRVALVGCGAWGRNLARVLAELDALAAVVDPVAEQANEVAAAHGVPVEELDVVLATDDIQAVVIAAPASLHFALASRVLAAGKHVFVEKPLALHSADAEELVAHAERDGLVLMVGHLMQYHPAFTQLKELVRAGKLGRVRYVYSTRLNLGRIRREENILWSFAPHDISMILSLIGSEPDAVSAVGSAFLHKTIADVTTTHLAFPGGEQAHVFVSWLHPFKEQRLVVIGETAMAMFDDGAGPEERLRIWPHSVEWREGDPHPVRGDGVAIAVDQGEPLRREMEHFLSCCESGGRPLTDGYEGVRVLRVLERAQAALSGSPAIPEASLDGVTIHDSAYVDQPSEIGPGTRIWHFSHVLSGSHIGPNCSIGQNVVIGPNVRIGKACKIQNNVSVYEGVTFEDHVFCGPSVVFTNVVNPRSEVERRDEFRPTLVRTGATLGANSTIVCGREIGRYAFVAAGAVVTRDVPDYALVAGVPAQRIGWMSRAGGRLNEDLVCPITGERYRRVGPDRVEPESE
jgi:predicted dehydrogenase